MKKQIMIALLMLINCVSFVQAVKLDTNVMISKFFNDIQNNNFEQVKERLDIIIKNYGPDINKIVEENAGNTPYHKVLYEKSNFDIMPYLELFYKSNLDINKEDAEGYTPLHLAVKFNDPKSVKFFIDRGAEIKTKNNNDESVIDTAKYAKKEIKDMLKNLQTKNEDKIEPETTKMDNPDSEKTEINKTFLDAITQHEIEINGKHVKNNIDIIKHILQKIDTGNARLFSFRQYQIDYPNGINDIMEKKTGYTPYHKALVSLNESTIMPYLKLFYDYGLDVNKKDAQGETPLHLAVRVQFPKAVKFFLDKGAIVNTQRNDTTTPLHSAKKYGNKEIIKMLEEIENKRKLQEEFQDKKQLQYLKQALEKNSKSYGMETMLFKYAPNKDQKNFEAYTDKEELYTISTYTDKDGDIHYTIEYYNPFDKRSFYNEKGFIEPRPISKEEYDNKKNEIDNVIKKYDEADRTKISPFRIISIKNFKYPEIKYIESDVSLSKNNDNTYRYHSNLQNNINYINYQQSVVDVPVPYNGKLKRIFDTSEKSYEQQQRLLKKLHEEWGKKQPKEEFKKEKEVPTDFFFKYA